jgi:hypothetical protein
MQQIQSCCSTYQTCIVIQCHLITVIIRLIVCVCVIFITRAANKGSQQCIMVFPYLSCII